MEASSDSDISISLAALLVIHSMLQDSDAIAASLAPVPSMDDFNAMSFFTSVGKGKPVAGIVEAVLNGSILRLTLLPDRTPVTVAVAGVQCPSMGKRPAAPAPAAAAPAAAAPAAEANGAAANGHAGGDAAEAPAAAGGAVTAASIAAAGGCCSRCGGGACCSRNICSRSSRLAWVHAVHWPSAAWGAAACSRGAHCYACFA